MSWVGKDHLREYFEEFVRAGGRFAPSECDARPNEWKQAMTVLCSGRLQMEMRGAIGAAAQADIK